jgi:hypothetical protein
VVAQVMNPADIAGELSAKLRLPPELRRPAANPNRISDGELQQTTHLVSIAANTISEMARRNKVIESEARAYVEKHKAETEAAKELNVALQGQIESLQSRMDEMAIEFQGRVQELQDKLNACREDLERKTRDAEMARQWLVYLSAEVMERLGDAPAKLEELARETRAGLRPD